MKNKIDKLISELELISVDLRRSADNLDETIKNIKKLRKCDLKHVEDRDNLLLRVIQQRSERSRGQNAIEKREKKILKQLNKEIRQGF